MTSLASRRLAASCLAVVLCAEPATSSAQTLADVARAAAARRKEQPKSGKVYTNDNLKSDITPSAPAPAAATPATPAPGGAAAAADAAPAAAAGQVTDARDQRAKEEATWRTRIGDARAAVERSMAFAAALQTQISSLTADFVNRDDPAQRSQIEQQRVKAVAELERTQREIEANRKAVAAIEEEARKAGVPAGWLR